jgi:DNA topoisomerase-1
MPYELIIAEKPSVAKKMAEALADGKPNKKQEGQVSYYMLSHNKKDIVVCCAVGHLFTVAENKKQAAYPSFDIKWAQSADVNKSSEFTKKYANVIKKLAKDANEFTVATDFDIEGEVIGYNIVKYLCKQKDANRMKFSAMTKVDLVKAYANKMNTLSWGQVHAGTTRHELDWFYGINVSRALTQSIKKAGRYKTLSSGRVQGPALKILVEKEKAIKAFDPQPYWDITLAAEHEKEAFTAEHSKNPIQDEKTANEVTKKTNMQTAKVDKITTRKFKQAPPTPFDLTSMQVESYKLFGIQPKDTLSLLQELYVGGWTSYPRTSSQKLPKDLGYKQIITDLAKQEKYKKQTAILLAEKELIPNEGKKKDDAHPALYPTGQVPPELEGRQLKVYDLVVKRFFATFGKPATRESVKAEIGIEGETFLAKGNRTVDKAWHELYAPYVKLEETTLPPFSEGTEVVNKGVTVEFKETKPPKRYTPASIIKELEKRELGTKATRAAIVENLYDRGYVDAKSITATDVGIQTIEVLEKYLPEILDEAMTRKIEEDMESIRKKKITPDKVKDSAKDFLTKTLGNFKEKEEEIGKALLQATRDGDAFGACPNCNTGSVVLKKGKYGRFLGCNSYPDCKTILKVPATGKISRVLSDDQEEGKFFIMHQVPRRGMQRIDLLGNKIEEDREPVEGEDAVCDKCGKGKMKYRKSFYGAFLGCDQYPACKNLKSLKTNPNA